jgi:xanthine dehydrogenase accessory factor
MNPTEFGQLHAAVLALEAADFARPAALATIIRTRGSTFRHAGARMLVHADGEVVCALSGGCPQRDIVERARRSIMEQRMRIARYGRDESLDVLIEMGCGGELDVLIEPLLHRADHGFLHALAQAQQQRRSGWLATLFNETPHSSARVRHLVHAGGVLWDDFDAPELSARAAALAASAADERASCVQAGEATLLIERFAPPPLLVLVGMNTVSVALAKLAAEIGWKSILVTQSADEPAHALPAGCELRITTPALARSALPCDAQCALVAMTFNLEQDIAWLRALGEASFGYFGAIGSRERSARLRAACPQARLSAPAGLDLGADGPGEIAVSIAAEIIAQRHARSGASLSKEAS